MEAYLTQLRNWLASNLENGMSLSELDGYLTGLIISPDLVPQSKWFGPIWGDAPPTIIEADDLQRFLDLLMRHHNAIIDNLNRPQTYSPFFEIQNRTGEAHSERWLAGFVRAMKLAPAGWNRIRMSDDADAKASLEGITQLAQYVSQQHATGPLGKPHRNAEASNLLPTWISLLHEWRLENDKHRPSSAETGKIGRNDPCLCGSGKKYKKCCGLN